MTISNNIAITTPTCVVQNPSVTVNLPKVAANALPSPDSAAGATPFDINLLCSGAKVSYTVSGNQLSSGYYSLLVPNTGSGAATGVWIDIQDRTTNPWSGIQLNTGQYLLGDTTGQSNVPLTIKLAARYYRINSATVVNAGTVTANANLNLSYQ